MVTIPKQKRTFCPSRQCRKHTLHKITQYKKGRDSLIVQGAFSSFLSLSRARALWCPSLPFLTRWRATLCVAWMHNAHTGKRRYDRKQRGFGGQTKPVFRKKAKTTKKIVLRLECTECGYKLQRCLKRAKHFELANEKKKKKSEVTY